MPQEVRDIYSNRVSLGNLDWTHGENETVAEEQKQKEYPPHPKGEAGLWTGSAEGMCPRMLQGNNNR